LSLIFNPLGPPFDFVGTSGTPSTPIKYSAAISSASFILVSGFYEITITAATHGAGVNPISQVFELITGNYELIQPTVIINGAGDITIQVSSSPDLRFDGKLIIT